MSYPKIPERYVPVLCAVAAAAVAALDEVMEAYVLDARAPTTAPVLRETAWDLAKRVEALRSALPTMDGPISRGHPLYWARTAIGAAAQAVSGIHWLHDPQRIVGEAATALHAARMAPIRLAEVGHDGTGKEHPLTEAAAAATAYVEGLPVVVAARAAARDALREMWPKP